MCELWVDEPWTSEPDSRGVSIIYRSGGETYKRRMSRADYRRGLESEIRKLNAFEAAEQKARRVVRMPPAKHG